MTAPNIILLRKNMIIGKLRACGAVSAETALTLADAGVRNPDGFSHITDWLVRKGMLKRTPDGRYYL